MKAADGSGNIGASNVWRSYGRRLGVPVALLDVVKGFVPAYVGLRVGGEWVGVLAGSAAMLGHARPIWLGFTKGGKMVATGGGGALALAPLAAGICLLIWIATLVLFRYASLASLVPTAGQGEQFVSLTGHGVCFGGNVTAWYRWIPRRCRAARERQIREESVMTESFKSTINVDVRDSVADWAPFDPPKAPDAETPLMHQ